MSADPWWVTNMPMPLTSKMSCMNEGNDVHHIVLNTQASVSSEHRKKGILKKVQPKTGGLERNLALLAVVALCFSPQSGAANNKKSPLDAIL